jgi:hypothetical protein
LIVVFQHRALRFFEIADVLESNIAYRSLIMVRFAPVQPFSIQYRICS